MSIGDRCLGLIGDLAGNGARLRGQGSAQQNTGSQNFCHHPAHPYKYLGKKPPVPQGGIWLHSITSSVYTSGQEGVFHCEVAPALRAFHFANRNRVRVFAARFPEAIRLFRRPKRPWSDSALLLSVLAGWLS